MATEKIYIIGGTGNVGTRTVKDLLRNDSVSLTLYGRSPEKIERLFGNPSNLTVVQGDYYDLKSFEETIVGHTRLFLLTYDPDMHDSERIGTEIAKTAYAAGVKQIVYVSGAWAGFPWRTSLIGSVVYNTEGAIQAIPNRGAFVTLRPSIFMSNHFWIEIHTIKAANLITSTLDADTKEPWISPNDIGTLAANVLQDPIKKHADAVYEMYGDVKSPKERAEILTKVLGKEIQFTQITDEKCYEYLTKEVHMEHLKAYDLLQYFWSSNIKVTPGLSLLLGREPETLEEWFTQNKSAFL
ncbi:hypothetical protein BJV82DRAFT_638311 [Fennellomyces sp. T-0311]|nr:hypothetical protein BJV82DRAFT_638311 [Fennellomyces sp. T-0311]